jgi:hypothetical protein
VDLLAACIALRVEETGLIKYQTGKLKKGMLLSLNMNLWQKTVPRRLFIPALQ